jgi:hypothetical protein
LLALALASAASVPTDEKEKARTTLVASAIIGEQP